METRIRELDDFRMKVVIKKWNKACNVIIIKIKTC